MKTSRGRWTNWVSRSFGASSPHAVEEGNASPLPGFIHQVEALRVGDLKPAGLVLLDETRHRQPPASMFCAVLACPRCGIPTLITTAQYHGVVPITCGADDCPCQVKIDEHGSLIYLPVN